MLRFSRTTISKSFGESFFFQKVFLIILLSVSFQAHAQINCDLQHRVDFEEAIEGLTRLNQPLSFVSASVRLEIIDLDPKKKVPRTTRCSGSFISDTGEFLTAAHCIEHCKPDNPCTFRINGSPQEVQILYAPKCNYKEAYSRKSKSNDAQTRCQTEEGIDDLLVIHPLDWKSLDDFSCLNISEEKAPLGEKVFTMGYPSATDRGGVAKDSDGKNLLLSSGEIVQRETCDLMWRSQNKFQEWLFGPSSSRPLSIDPSNHQRLGMIQSTVDIVRGSSGGPLINAEGKIVGVASSSLGVNNNSKECRGATFFQPISRLSKKLEGKVSPCREKKASAGASI